MKNLGKKIVILLLLGAILGMWVYYFNGAIKIDRQINARQSAIQRKSNPQDIANEIQKILLTLDDLKMYNGHSNYFYETEENDMAKVRADLRNLENSFRNLDSRQDSYSQDIETFMTRLKETRIHASQYWDFRILPLALFMTLLLVFLIFIASLL